MDIEKKVTQILGELTDNEYRELFANVTTIDEKLQLLTSESLLALMFITSVEDEFSISFDDDEIDINFFSSVESVVNKINNALNETV
jgi:acyl carrier protein